MEVKASHFSSHPKAKRISHLEVLCASYPISMMYGRVCVDQKPNVQFSIRRIHSHMGVLGEKLIPG